MHIFADQARFNHESARTVLYTSYVTNSEPRDHDYFIILHIVYYILGKLTTIHNSSGKVNREKCK